MKKIYYSFLIIFFLGFGLGITLSYSNNQNSIVMVENRQETKISFHESRLIVENLQEDSILEIFSIVGVKVYSVQVKAGTNEYYINLPKGYYIVRIGKIAKKIALR